MARNTNVAKCLPYLMTPELRQTTNREPGRHIGTWVTLVFRLKCRKPDLFGMSVSKGKIA